MSGLHLLSLSLHLLSLSQMQQIRLKRPALLTKLTALPMVHRLLLPASCQHPRRAALHDFKTFSLIVRAPEIIEQHKYSGGMLELHAQARGFSSCHSALYISA